MVAKVQSHDIAEEARKWLLRQLERGNVDAADPPPKLAVWQDAISEIAKGVFSDADDDAIFRECLRQAIIDVPRRCQRSGAVAAQTKTISCTYSDRQAIGIRTDRCRLQR